MANEVRIVIRGDDRSDAAFRDATRGSGRLEHALDDAADAAADLGREATEAGADVERALGDRAAGAADDLGESTDDAGGMMGQLGKAGAVAGAALAAAMAIAAAAVAGLQKAIEASTQRAADLGRMKAQLLLDPEDAAKYGKIAAEVYMDNWGETLEEASSYVRDAAMLIMPTLAEMDNAITPSLKVVAERVAALANTMDEDGKKVAAAVKKMLVTGMAQSADEAFNLIHKGISRGVDEADDLLDTFIEYSTIFREVGINGREAMGLIAQGLEAGARDADTMADAIKELGILVQDVSNAKAQAAFKSMGLNAQKLGVEFNAGGARAKAALDQVLEALNAIEDPLQQRAIALALFGTKAEDLGNALFNMDLDQAAKDFENLGNAADVAAAHMSGNGYSAIEGYRRRWEMFQADMGDRFLPVFEKVMGAINAFADRVAPTVHYWLEKIAKKWSENSDSVEEFGELAAIALGAMGEGAIGAVLSGLDMLVDTIILIGDAWAAAKRWTAVFVMAALDGFGKILHMAAIAFGWIPGIGPKLIAAEIEFQRFASKVNADLAAIQDQNVNVNVWYNPKGSPPPGMAGGKGASNSGWRIMGSGGTGSGVVLAGERGPELIDLGASGRVYNPEQTRRMVQGGISGSGGGASTGVPMRGRYGNNAGPAAAALDTLMRYLLPKLVDSRGGRVRVV